MKCPVCGAAELIHDTRDLPYTYKGETTIIAAVTGDFCPACAESVLDAAESNRVMREMRAFSKQVNAAIVDPSFFNWPALPVALADTILPDFPLTNKSFNLSYSGNDL